MRYIVESVSGVYPANFGQQRVAFMVQGNPNKLSGFFPTALAVGQEIDGDIIQKGQYWNFIIPKKAPQNTPGAPDLNRLEVKLDATRTDIGLLRGDISDMKGVLGSILQKLGPAEDSPFP